MAKTPEEIKDFNLAAQEFLSSVASLGSALKENAKNIKSDTGETLAKSVIETQRAQNIATKYKELSQEALASTQKRASVLKDIENLTSIQNGIQAEIAELGLKQQGSSKKLTKLELKRLEHLTNANESFEEFQNIAKKVQDEVKEINEQTELFDNLAELTSQIPGIGVVFKEFGAASKAAGEAASKGGSAMAAGAKQLAGAVGKMMTVFTLGKFLEGITKGQENITEFSRQLNISREEADTLNKRLNRLGRATTGIVGADLVAATFAVSNNLGISAELSDETATTFATITKRLGLSVEQAAKLTSYTSATGQGLKEFNSNLIGSVIAQNAVTDSAIRYQDVLKDVASAGAATQLTVSKFPGGLAKAAFQARKFGLSMSALEQSGQSLLNFESSIEAELEAELLTGKELNLERARAAALTGDQATLAAELAKNFGTAEEFGNQSVIAQEAQAKAMGMSRDELAQALVNQQAMQTLQMDQSKSLKQNIKLRKEEIQRLRDIGDAEEANKLERELYTELGDDETLRQQKNMSLMETQRDLLIKISEAAQSIAKPFDVISSLLKGLGTSAFEFLGFVSKIGSKLKALGGYFGEAVAKNLDVVGKAVSGFFPKMITALAKGGKAALIGLKKIPVIGLLVGLGMAYKRMAEGDIFGGLLEIGSGVASLFPGIGTGVSMAIDAGLMATDMAGVTGENMGVGMARFNDNISMGLGGETTANAIIKAQERAAKAAEETTAAIKNMKGEVKIDGNVAGRSYVLAQSKLP